MPELPEVENLRQSLASLVLGQRVRAVEVRRDDYTHGNPTALVGGTVSALHRHGKQLALTTNEAGPSLVIHLGMSGQLRFHPSTRRRQPVIGSPKPATSHDHLAIRLDAGNLMLHDPRRFGGAWAYPSLDALRRDRWSRLGPDALTITADQLHAALRRTRRHLKAALLDQSLIAGLGNIYVDELLFQTRLSPLTRSHRLSRHDTEALTDAIPDLLLQAIAAGGSSLRDYVDANGEPGGFQSRHNVYGRHGQPCKACSTPLIHGVVAGRSTVVCPACQSVSPRGLARASGHLQRQKRRKKNSSPS